MGAWPHPPSLLTRTADGVPVSLLRGPSTRRHEPDDAERQAVLFLLDAAIERSRPEILLANDVGPLSAEVLGRARARGLATVLRVGDGTARDPLPFTRADAVLAPTR